MRILAIFAFAACLAGCTQTAAQQTIADPNTCINEVKSSPEAQIVNARVWSGDDSDNAQKLADPNPLSEAERTALVTVHNKMLRCRQAIIAHVNSHAAWQTPHWQEMFQRNAAIFYKVGSGQIPVGVANKLAIESNGKFQADLMRGHADAVIVEEWWRQRTAETLLHQSAKKLATQRRQRTTTPNCTWQGNTLDCTSML